MKKLILLFFCFAILLACQNERRQIGPLSGGDNTVIDLTREAFGHPSPTASEKHQLEFFTGRSLFEKNWVAAPSSTPLRDGLGPMFHAASCSSCHLKDGRGLPDPKNSLLIRLSLKDNSPHPLYGGQFQVKGIEHSVDSQNRPLQIHSNGEGDVVIEYKEISGNYADGTPYSLRKPIYHFKNLRYGDLKDILTSPRVAPPVFGLGLLENISEKDILNREDPDDENQDGISGRANFVRDLTSNQTVLGRFGWKANQPTIRQQIAGALNGDMGITSEIFESENCTAQQKDCLEAFHGGEPEITKESLDRLELYIQILAVPARRQMNDPQTQKGEDLFYQAKCSSCHQSTFITQENKKFPELSKQIIHPYTDLLLHDMGEGLADNRPDAKANGQEWRTPPLWGIGLTRTVNQHENFLHDGRARGLEEAILWHGGEAEDSKNTFVEMSKNERQALLAFLNSL